MDKKGFIENIGDHDDLRNHYLSDLSRNLESSANHFRKLSFYIVLIPLIYISVGFSGKSEMIFLGVELDVSLLIALFPVIYSYITLRAYTLWLIIKDMKDVKISFYEEKLDSKFNEFFFLLNPFSLTNSNSYKLPESCIVFLFVLLLFPFMVITSLFPPVFQVYMIYNLYVAELSSSFLYYASLIVAIMFSLQLLYTMLKAYTYFLGEFRART